MFGYKWKRSQASIKKLLIAFSCLNFTACNIAPRPFTVDESYQKAQCELQRMFAHQPPICGTLDFSQAMAHGLQFNLENRVKQANVAIKAGQMEIAEYAMLPVLGASGSIYNRSNQNATFGSNPNGTADKSQIAFGADKTLRNARLGLKWNLIDLGMGYVKTKEEGERILIAEEESRQQLQKLVQEIRAAYWAAYNAQEMKGELLEFHRELQTAKEQLNRAFADKLIPKEDLFRHQAILLDGNRKLVQLEDKLRKSTIVLRYLINLPNDEPLVLEKPPVSMYKIQDLRNLDFVKLDAITLVNRPELRSQGYQKRIAELGVKTAIFQALPVVTLNQGSNWDSNSFVLNHFWNDRSIEASWNIFNLLALPVSLRNVRTQVDYETLKLMALTLGALNETRIAYAHYQNTANEAKVAREQRQNAAKFYKYLNNRNKADLASPQQVILARLFMIYSSIDEMLLIADLTSALGDLYTASGFDVVPVHVLASTPEELLCIIRDNLGMQEKLGFKGYVNVTYNRLFEAETICPN